MAASPLFYAEKMRCRKQWRSSIYVPLLLVSALLAVSHTSSSPRDSLERVARSTVNESQAPQDCLESTLSEFPRDLFTNQQRRHGALAIHVLVAVYMFLAMDVVCDDYFVPSLEILCNKIRMSEDVAGATLMAAGSSAPEFFTALIGVFITKGDVGVSTIVGSAVFNILCIIGVCALFSGAAIRLSWWPLVRDSVFYAGSVVLLLVVAFDDKVSMWEAMVMLGLYGVYIVLMAFNHVIQGRLSPNRGAAGGGAGIHAIAMRTATPLGGSTSADHPDLKQLIADDGIQIQLKMLAMADASLRIMLMSNFKPMCRMRAAARIIIAARRQHGGVSITLVTHLDDISRIPSPPPPRPSPRRESAELNSVDVPLPEHAADNGKKNATQEDDDDDVFDVPASPVAFVKWLILLPIGVAFLITVPDCRKARWRSWYLVGFLGSILWISVLSYVMVWMVTVIGHTLSVPDTVMGITFLAAGTSIPDCMASLLVARQGMGDMAVSNSIGSNIFDILIGLAFPWLLKTSVSSFHGEVPIRSAGLKYSIVLLFVSVAVTIAAIRANHWILDRKLGVFFLSLYGSYLVVACMIELNMFAYVNPPPCPLNS